MLNNNLEIAVNFIRQIGINVVFKDLGDDTFLPGLHIERGNIYVDLQKLKYPGDILHEAGHLACLEASERNVIRGEEIGSRPTAAAEEMAAIAWSYAACKHLGLPSSFVFHESGYKGEGSNLMHNFDNGQYFGVPILQWFGMSAELSQAGKLGLPVYPSMAKWLRD
ncbi:hypothetical protein COR50_17100 [Chitinophaga caeni]|uniref:IrrE N-terminal-like domain-containing protein n=1 Tax=Chitinophaga caeni TaxID=2029983 RepID=A0A291QXV0_9BACT|nr:hypothetical protein [Chitinophaga caeni]ATL48741.1 hypothetical protein COR50_17100 [Chitinophaga caeni]